jgi:hypothetical protein
MRANDAHRSGNLFGAACLLWAAASVLVAVAARAEGCEGALCSTLLVTATSSRTSFEEGERVVYSATLRNLSTRTIRGVILQSHGASLFFTGEGPGCHAENQGWTNTSSPTFLEVWRRAIGNLAPGAEVTVSFCLEALPSGIGPGTLGNCELSQVFFVYFEVFSPENPFSIVSRRRLGCRLSPCRIPLGEAGAGCCAVQALHCLFHPSDSLCGGGAVVGTGAALERVASSVVAASARYFTAATDLSRLYVLRDRVLGSTSGGRGAVALYNTHQAELKRLLLADPALRERAIDVLTAWRPVINEVIGQPGAATTISAARVAELESFLAELRVMASPGLRAAIDRESQALSLDSIGGLSVDKALQRLDKLTCIPDTTTLCLSGGRVRVETAWETADGKRGSGRAVALTGDTGTFWFFAAANVETIVKVVDACSFNDRRWVFAAGLTDVAVVTTVTDTATGVVRTYRNPRGGAFAPVQDTNALDCSP